MCSVFYCFSSFFFFFFFSSRRRHTRWTGDWSSDVCSSDLIKLAPELWRADVDPTQIELVLLNLAINARDAMENAGSLVIETANVTCGPPERQEHPPAGDYVMRSEEGRVGKGGRVRGGQCSF